MVGALLAGRLGNFLFQASNALAYGKRYNAPVVFDASCPYRSYFPYLNFIEDFRPMVDSFTYYKEPSHAYTQIPHIANVLFDGYFQSELYFKQFREYIIQVFGFYTIEPKEKTCFIHYRAGDYRLYPTKHPIISDEYLAKAIDKMKEKGISRFLVFSDEPEAIKDILLFIDKKDCEFKIVTGNLDLNDMKIMASCSDGICSASTFSWWGAWFMHNPNKTIIVPKDFFGIDNAHLDTKDIYPADWIKL